MDRVKSGYFIPNTDKLSKLASSYNSFEDGDIILAKVTPCFENGNIAIAENLVQGKGFGSSELFVIRPHGIERRFLFYCLQSALFKQEGEASMTGAGGLKRISSDVLRRHRVQPFSRQRQIGIASYLDRETARIDELIAEKERMLALLEQKRAALISRAVTRSLNPQEPTKPSGLDWLGQIPNHWEVRRLKFLVAGVDQGSSPQCDSHPAKDGGVGVLKTGCVNGGIFNEEANKTLPSGIDVNPAHIVHSGDILMSRASGSVNLIGSVAMVEHEPSATLLLSDKLYRLQNHKNLVDGSFLVLAMGSTVVRHQIRAIISGADGLANNISKTDILELIVVLPPLSEQMAIISHIQAYQSRTAALGAALRDSIALLKERRSALITAAVTGRLDIPRHS